MKQQLLSLPRPMIVLVGRTNVGKSTLFNRMLGHAHALVSSIPRTTRDILIEPLEWQMRTGTLIDTGGLSYPPSDHHFTKASSAEEKIDPILAEVRTKVIDLLGRCDHICFVVDGKAGLSALDREWGRFLLSFKTPVTVVVNKIDNPSLRAELAEWYSLGVKSVFGVSAVSGSGMGDLLDHLLPVTQMTKTDAEQATLPASSNIVIMGKPNVGKSTLFNTLVGLDEAIVSATPHTTREPHRRKMTLNGQPIALYDTVGIRRHKTAREALERAGAQRTLTVLSTSDVAVLVLDPINELLSHQDQELGRLIQEAKSACVIAINKSDLLPEATQRTVAERSIRKFFPHLSFATVVFISAKEQKGISVLRTAIDEASTNHKREFTPDELHKGLEDMVLFPNNPAKRKAANTLEQVSTKPPEFLVKRLKKLKTPIAIIHLIEKRIRLSFPLAGTPIVVHVERFRKPIPNRKAKK